MLYFCWAKIGLLQEQFACVHYAKHLRVRVLSTGRSLRTHRRNEKGMMRNASRREFRNWFSPRIVREYRRGNAVLTPTIRSGYNLWLGKGSLEFGQRAGVQQ